MKALAESKKDSSSTTSTIAGIKKGGLKGLLGGQPRKLVIPPAGGIRPNTLKDTIARKNA